MNLNKRPLIFLRTPNEPRQPADHAAHGGPDLVLLWAVVNRPDIEPPLAGQGRGLSFSPMRGEQSPVRREYPDIAQIDEDLALLAGDAHAVRTYTVEGTMGEVPRPALAHGPT